jgi:phenylacetate-CoA ligase
MRSSSLDWGPGVLPLDEFDPLLGAWSNLPDDAELIAEWQLARAWELAEDLAEGNPFYRHRLRLPSGRTSTDFRTLPLTRKAEVVADCDSHPPFGSRTRVSPEEVRMVVQTSGTSGRGVEVYALNTADQASVVRTEAVGFLWAGVGPGARVLLTLPIGMTAAGLWYYAGLRALAANVLAVGSYPTERKVEILERFGAEVIIGTPSYVHRLATACQEAGIDPGRLGVKALIVAGEPYSEHWAASIQRRFGAVLYEQYGCTERAIAWTCPGGVLSDSGLSVLHFPPESAYCEVVDPTTGSPVENGGEGELIVTPLGVTASPLLRYATGDRVRWRAPGACRCRRPLAGIAAGEVQRWDDMMKIRGVNVWPAQFDRAIFGVAGVADYRGVVGTDPRGSETVEVRLEVLPGSGDTGGAVAEAVRRATGLTVRVTVEPPGTLSSQVPEGFVKIKRWRDERKVR